MNEESQNTAAFPGRLPLEKPADRPLSAAMQRLYDMWTPMQGSGQSILYRLQVLSSHWHRQGRIGVVSLSPRPVKSAQDRRYLLCLVYAPAHQVYACRTIQHRQRR